MNIKNLLQNKMEREVNKITNKYTGLYKVLQGETSIRAIKEEYSLPWSRQALSDELKTMCYKTEAWPEFTARVKANALVMGTRSYSIDYGCWAIPLREYIKHNDLFLGEQ